MQNKKALFGLTLRRAEGTNDEATFEISGSAEWLERVLPFIGLTIAGITKAYGLDRYNADQVKRELVRAHEALRGGRNYAGAYVTTRLEGASVEELGKGYSSRT